MPTAAGNKTYFTFVKGIITEASPLIFPENASLDEANFVLNRDGSRQRRLGMDYENEYVLKDTGSTYAVSDEEAISVGKWEAVNDDAEVSFGVIQVGDNLWFVDIFKDSLTSNFKHGGNAFTIYGAGDSPIQLASINGKLIVTGKSFAPVYLEYNSGTDTVSSTAITFKIRDFYGVDDGLETATRPSTLTDAHKYNLLNQGWFESNIDDAYNEKVYDTWAASTSYADDTYLVPTVQNGYYYKVTNGTVTSGATEPVWPTVIGDFVTDSGGAKYKCMGLYQVYPSNADIMALGKNATDVFDIGLMDKQFTGNTPAPKGHFIIDAFDRGVSRRSESGVTSLASEGEQGHITTAAAYSGRMFYSGVASSIVNKDDNSPNYSGGVFFTKLINNEKDLGTCYQEADPTSEHVSDLIATDGGYISIPEAAGIMKLVATERSLIIFASNGVWELTGSLETGFSASDYQVNRLSTIGAISAESIVNAEGTLSYWAEGGIYFIAPSETGTLTAINATASTIQTLYDAIPSVGRKHAVGQFDPATRRITWKFNDLDTYDGTTYVNNYNKELVYDTLLQAFFVTEISYIDSVDSPYVAGSVITPNFVSADYVSDVVVGGDQVQVSLDDVVITEEVRARGTSYTKHLTILPNSAGNMLFTFSHYRNDDFVDWYTYDSTGADYSSYLITGYEIAGDSTRWKQSPYITFHFIRTETGFEEVGGALNAVGASSCLVTPYWDFADHANSGKIGSQFQAYRLKRNYIPTGAGDAFDYGHSVITTKSKLRGKGDALSLRIESEAGKDMHLLGWGMPFTMAIAV